MTQRGPRQIRDAANALLDSLVKAVEQAYGDKPVSGADLRRLADELKNSTALDPVYDKAFADMQGLVFSQALEAQRVETFHRLMTHPLDPMLESEELHRDALPNFFNFLRLVLGEQVDALQKRCAEVHDDLKAKLGDGFLWEAFYADDRCKAIYYEVLVKIAAAFQRFDARRDWFIGVMQYTPSSIAISSNAFIPQPHHATWTFGPENFRRMFQLLFAPVKALNDADRALFQQATGTAPDEAFGAFFRNLG